MEHSLDQYDVISQQKHKILISFPGSSSSTWDRERLTLTSRVSSLEDELRRKEAAIVDAVNEATQEGDIKVSGLSVEHLFVIAVTLHLMLTS